MSIVEIVGLGLIIGVIALVVIQVDAGTTSF
jgi:hypothetical protein